MYLPWLGREADTATRLDARRFQQHLLDTRSPGGAALYLRTIKAMYGWALREELIEANPFQGLSIRPPQDVQTTATPEQIEFLLRTASSQSDKRPGTSPSSPSWPRRVVGGASWARSRSATWT